MTHDGSLRRNRFARTWLAPLAALPLLAGLTLPASAEQAIIVLDASGSMWGRIANTEKIVIARDVLSEVLATTPADLSLGLMAYGHREEGNCADIELVVPPATGTGSTIANAAGSISPRGKTPLSDSVRMAAEMLRYTEEKATVILITDGLETCNADPCALARELEASGVDFTTHVVGFGLSAEEGRQVACLADETGGSYIQAQDAGALGNALADTVAAAAAPPPPPPPEPEEVAELPEASLDAPDEVEIGALFDVQWEGPGEDFDRIVIFDPAAGPEGEEVRGRRLITSPGFEERSVRLVAPAQTGPYELQYYYGRSRDIIATRPVEVVAAEVSLSAPATVDIGATFTVEWVGPGADRDYVELFDPAAGPEGDDVTSRRLVNGDYENRTVDLVAPAEPGFYQLRYWNGDNRTVLATREIEILPADVGLSAPASVSIGSTFEVTWNGPGGNRDTVEIFNPRAGPEGDVIGGKRLVNDDYANRTVRLTAPATPGDYVLRYWNGDNRAVLATTEITVEDAEVGLEAPESVDMGRTFQVTWAGPGANRDTVEIVAAAEAPDGRAVESKRLVNDDYENRTVTLTAPPAPGDYVLRYWNGDSRKVLATRPLTVVEIPVSVSGPGAVAAGDSFQVTWEGPGAYRDRIEVFSVALDKAVTSKRLVNDDYEGRTATLKAPDEAGEYLLRYWNGDGRRVLAEEPLTVQ